MLITRLHPLWIGNPRNTRWWCCFSALYSFFSFHYFISLFLTEVCAVCFVSLHLFNSYNIITNSYNNKHYTRLQASLALFLQLHCTSDPFYSSTKDKRSWLSRQGRGNKETYKPPKTGPGSGVKIPPINCTLLWYKDPAKQSVNAAEMSPKRGKAEPL